MRSLQCIINLTQGRTRRLFFGVASTLAISPALAQAPLPTIQGNLLRMPVVLVLGTPYSIDWQIVQTNGLIDLLLHQFSAVSGVDTTGAPSFDGTILNLPRLEAGGVSYWGEFRVDSTQPIIFRLHDANVNNPGSSGVAGKWSITEQTNAQACGEGITSSTYVLTVAQQGSTITVKSSVGTFTANLQGTSLQWSGSYNEDGGTVNTNVGASFTGSLNSLSGTSTWSWGNGSSSCNGSSSFTGKLLHN